jgi:hypothetical protein
MLPSRSKISGTTPKALPFPDIDAREPGARKMQKGSFATIFAVLAAIAAMLAVREDIVGMASLDVADHWYFVLAVERAAYRPYLGHRFVFVGLLEKTTTAVKGNSELACEDGRPVTGSNRRPIELVGGSIFLRTLDLQFIYHGLKHATTGTMHLEADWTDANHMTGTFHWTAGNVSGVVRAYRGSDLSCRTLDKTPS